MAAGIVTFGTTAQTLTGYVLPVYPGSSISVKAAFANSGSIYVGLSSALSTTANGYELPAGQEIRLGRLVAPYTSSVWVIAGSTGQKVTWFVDVPDDMFVQANITNALDFSKSFDSGYAPLIIY